MKRIFLLFPLLLLANHVYAQQSVSKWFQRQLRAVFSKEVRPSATRLIYKERAHALLKAEETDLFRREMEKEIASSTESFHRVLVRYERLAEQNELLAEQARTRRLEDIKYFLDNRDFFKSKVTFFETKKINYIKRIPPVAKTILIGEYHDRLVLDDVLEIIRQYKQAYPNKRLYYASEFIQDSGKDAMPVLLTTQSAVDEQLRHVNYVVLMDDLLRLGVPIVGLERPRYFPEIQKETEFAADVSFVGMKERNRHWAKIINQLRAKDPEAVIFVHAGIEHLTYHTLNSLPSFLKNAKTVVINLSAANQFFEDLLPSSNCYGCKQVWVCSDKRVSRVLGSDMVVRSR